MMVQNIYIYIYDLFSDKGLVGKVLLETMLHAKMQKLPNEEVVYETTGS